jgi:diguanylate cyclase (GGDEF)-like protein
VHDELQGDEQQIAQGITNLERNDALPDRAAVEVPFKRTMSSLWRIFELVSKGRSDESNKASDTAARQAAKADIALERAAAVNRTRSLHALRQARIESAAVILLLFAAYALFYRRATKARRRAEELAADNHRLLAASQEEALTDQLTGIGNRRALMADLESLEPAGEGEQTLLALFDLDGFKQYNDSFGHPAGDELLARLGRRLAESVGGTGAAFRMGGDEFCVLAAAGDGGEQLVARRAADALTETAEGCSIGCSSGLDVVPDEAHSVEEALRLADQRMYAEKAGKLRAA